MGNHIVYIEGNIGAGKSSVLDILESRGYSVVREAVDEWTFYSKYRSDPKRWCTTFEVQVMLSMVEKIENKLKTTRKWPIFVERSIMTAYIFSKVAFKRQTISREELKILHDLCVVMTDRFSMYSTTDLYLQCPVEECLERIKKRGRPGEEGITKDLLDDIEKMHGTGWTMIDATVSPEEVATEVLRHSEG